MNSPTKSTESSSDVENVVIVDEVTDILPATLSRPPLFDEDVVNIRSAVQVFYSKYNPEKINTIDNILKQYQGFEIQLVLHLIQKYNAVDKSDLDIFIGSLEVNELQQLAEYQIQLKNDDSKDCVPDYAKDDFKDESSRIDNTNKKPQSLESLKGVIGTAKQTLMTSNITDISNNLAGRFLNGWNSAANTVGKPGQPSSTVSNSNSAEHLNNAASTSTPPTPSSLSVADELLLTTRINSMQAEIQSLEAAKSHLFGNIRVLKSQVLFDNVISFLIFCFDLSSLLSAIVVLFDLLRNLRVTLHNWKLDFLYYSFSTFQIPVFFVDSCILETVYYTDSPHSNRIMCKLLFHFSTQRFPSGL